MTSVHAALRSSSEGILLFQEIVVLVCAFIHFGWTPGVVYAASGCADGSREGLYSWDNIAGCSGKWEGHVNSANVLCAPGWRVCTSFDIDILRNITWAQALAVPGCLAVNAAQDGGRCRECRADLEHDDMAGIGQDCPHKAIGQKSCISGGRIDASCCVDSHFYSACHYQPGVTTGVACCRLPAKKPNIVVKPPARRRLYKELIIVLTCQAAGMPPPKVHWYKDGRMLTKENPRINILSSGELLVTPARKSDSGQYMCEAINEVGRDTATSYVQVTEYATGCADGTTDGLNLHRDIHACAGTWSGHVRLGKVLCSKGWRVCSPKDQKSLQELSTYEIFDLPGCFAYNAATAGNKCRSCKSKKMSGVGKDCGTVSMSQSSCLSQRRIEVFPPNRTSSCEHAPGITTGVLCCKRPQKERENKTKCVPACQNDGLCMSHNRCHCKDGYKGARCQIAICMPPCGSKGGCIRPNTCQCKPGYTGYSCRKKDNSCPVTCQNGGWCQMGKCKCPLNFYGQSCQHNVQEEETVEPVKEKSTTR
ncbi:neurogenic locus notch protein 1-like isoform X1 [Biomphalaria pfeifferi]|uniref:Neurogenic locus notch protein 1-like isoform X1 n=1 Tax=Biomphalaria pfeifferi TaxID=112525 RepID=A0AAD8CC80_BIOPF|nr:neurogenic locus notch protein 1-like isoform X1 [Biomphalaria pfeifferi]